MDPRLLVPFQPEHYNSYLERHGSQQHLQHLPQQFHSLSSLPPATSFYSLDPFEHPPPGVSSSSIAGTSLPPPADRLSHQLASHYESLQPPPLIAPGASHDAGHWARNPGLGGGYAPSQVYGSGYDDHLLQPASGPGYEDMLQPSSASIQLASAYGGWSAEPYQQQVFHAWDHDRHRAEGIIGTIGALRGAPLQKPWSKKRLGKPKRTVQVEPPVKATKLAKVEPIAGKAKSKEAGPGWCSLCQRDCNTDAILKQHLSGKRHRKNLQQQNSDQAGRSAGTDKSLEGSTLADAIEQMWLKVSTMGKGSKSAISASAGKLVATGDTNGAAATDLFIGHGKKRRRGEIKTEEDLSNSAAANGLDAADSDVNVGIQKQEEIRCELCNVVCNSRAVLEIHFTGKKHQARLKKSLT